MKYISLFHLYYFITKIIFFFFLVFPDQPKFIKYDKNKTKMFKFNGFYQLI